MAVIIAMLRGVNVEWRTTKIENGGVAGSLQGFEIA